MEREGVPNPSLASRDGGSLGEFWSKMKDSRHDHMKACGGPKAPKEAPCSPSVLPPA